ncbi:undecaprenyl-diphosphate phosphatase [Thiosocius teredinicola]|uniref:undecaprenyl-diphosphate phosphatase n=1 Tax=Thiosocius teredinicola TaxID=1973002 RepID=UPI0009913901
MSDIQILVLAIVQGLTEFLPISSSGHLILAPHLFGFDDQGLAFDVAVHLGSLIAVVAYFRRDILQITLAWFAALPPGKQQTPNSRLGWAVIIGTLPVVAGGLLLKSLVENEFRAPWIIGTTTIVFGLVLAWVDLRARRQRELDSLTLGDALLIGASQILALVPGTSRSGITMTTGLWLGLTREAASRFSFLLSIPTILASSLLVTKDLLEAQVPVDWASLGLGVVLSGAAAFLAIALFLRFIERIGMWPFVIYRLLLGGIIFIAIY